MSTIITPTPGQPETYQKAPNDHRRRGAMSDIILVPINDPKRQRVVIAKVEEKSFDSLPEWVRKRPWCLVKDGGASESDRSRFTVRVGTSGNQVTLSRLIMKAQPGEIVRTVNGNRLDLRTTNLRTKGGASGARAKRNDLAIIRVVSG